jgi:hypothetical protein
VSVPASAALLLPSDAPLAWPALREDAARVRALPAGTRVALADRRPGGRRRLRRSAGRLGIQLEAEYVVLPTWAHATFVAADDPDTMTWLLATFFTTPPRVSRGRYLVEVVTRVGATRAGAATIRRVLGALAPGRLAIGTRR